MYKQKASLGHSHESYLWRSRYLRVAWLHEKFTDFCYDTPSPVETLAAGLKIFTGLKFDVTHS